MRIYSRESRQSLGAQADAYAKRRSKFYRLPVNWSTVTGWPVDPYWGFADIMTLEKGPSIYRGKEATDLIDEINDELAMM